MLSKHSQDSTYIVFVPNPVRKQTLTRLHLYCICTKPSYKANTHKTALILHLYITQLESKHSQDCTYIVFVTSPVRKQTLTRLHLEQTQSTLSQQSNTIAFIFIISCNFTLCCTQGASHNINASAICARFLS